MSGVANEAESTLFAYENIRRDRQSKEAGCVLADLAEMYDYSAFACKRRHLPPANLANDRRRCRDSRHLLEQEAAGLVRGVGRESLLGGGGCGVRLAGGELGLG